MSKKWYVVHAYSGFEKSVQRTLLDRISRTGMQEQFGQRRTEASADTRDKPVFSVGWHCSDRLRMDK